MSRVLDIAPENRTADQNAAFDKLAAGRGHIPTPYKVWIHSPQIALGMESIGTYLNKRAHLTLREVEIGVVLVARHWHGDYVLNNHARAAVKAGVDEATVEKMKLGETVTFADEREQAMYDLASTLLAGGCPSDDEFARYERALKREGIAEAMVLLGYSSAVSFARKAHQVQPGARGD